MGRFLFEGKFKERRVETPERIFDILDQIKKGDWITIGYVTSADLNVPKVQRRNPLTNRMKGYDDYSVFGNENGEIAGLVKISAWNFRYYNRHDVSSRYYNEYKPSVNAIRGDYGLDPVADKEGYTQTMNYGKGGVSVYGGGNEALQGHSYAPQNVANVKPRSTVYPIGQDGKILNFNGLSQEQIIPYLKAAREVDGVSKLRKMEVEDEKIQEYIKRIKDLNFSYKNFEQNSILWVAATVNGEALVYLNPNMTRVVNDITINTGDFLKIAANRYGKELDDIIRKSEQDRNMSQPMPESRKRYLRLTESDLRQVVREAATKILTEMAVDPTIKVQQLIQQANDAYRQTIEVQGQTEWPLMDKEGNPYGLSGEIRLDGRGYIIIPFNGGSYSPYNPEKIKVLTRAGGRIRLYPGDYMNNGWKDAAKMLKQIIRDAQIGNGHFQNYDPNWENSDNPEEYKANKAALRGMNKQIGRKASAGMDYIGKNY